MNNSDKRREKRRARELRKKNEPKPQVRLIYRPKNEEEGQRRWERTQRLLETPFVCLPGAPSDKLTTAFVTTSGYPVSFHDIEMVFNDALLCDAVSDWGKDGPLYENTLDSADHQEAYAWAKAYYAGVEIPEQLRRPE